MTGAAAGRVMAWLWGQDDNVGDSALRRGYADALRRVGTIDAYVGPASDSFVSGLGLATTDSVCRSFVPWLVSGFRGARPSVIAVNAGEFSMSGSYTVKMLALVPWLRAMRWRGVRVVWLGAAVPRLVARRTWLFRALFRSCDEVRWRDGQTSRIFEHAPWMPDWALGLDSRGASRPRTSLVVSLRSDRPYPTPEWLDAVRRCSARLEVETVVIAQVGRDSARARELAAVLGGRAVVFEEGTHAVQEQRVRDEYAGASVILSDRLHALLIAAAEGAVPLAWCEAATDKIQRHFDALGATWATCDRGASTGQIDGLSARWLEQRRADTAGIVADARSLLAAVAGETLPAI
ncbi:polysaccharide pyruvyl transferase family protein [Microbacterium sp.]|uniref:polysaccharide pyruvyl transferase family protein n=1 Tax=Microbacterium sp. TaxID=51671 RepID=UPI003A87A225